MNDGQRMVQQWIVRVDGIDLGHVEPGESVQIGRKPLRPLADEGIRRIEVQDATRSMSKRHAVFSVEDNGSATLRDLDSTNGSYVVRDNGDLMRIPEGVNFLLPTSPMRLQFGDVPVDFIRVEQHAGPEDGRTEVPDLFGYAVNGAHQEPDAADMSVDDILDLRAGEPTSMFDAGRVRQRAGEFDMAQYQTYQPYGFDGGSVPLHVTPQGQGDDASPRDLFADAADSPSRTDDAADSQPDVDFPAAEDDAVAEPTIGVSPADAASAGTYAGTISGESGTDAGGDGTNPGDDGVEPAATPVAEQAVPETSDMAGSASAAPSFGGDGGADDGAATGDSDAAAVASASAVHEPDGPATAEPAEPASVGLTAAEPAVNESVADSPAGDADPSAALEQPAPTVASAEPGSAVSPDAGPLGAQWTPIAQEPADQARFAPQTQPETEPEEPAYTPAFEPGSVFDRVAKGEFAQAVEQAIEVDGLSSDDAKRTTDFTVQFEMARHPQLLPFLAMNPSLYDDLYAWLAAQGDRDIDAALARNDGYQEYRKAVGK